MKDYRVDVIEHHVVRKTYFILANNKSEARKRAKFQDWDDATPDVPTGDIKVAKILKVAENK